MDQPELEIFDRLFKSQKGNPEGVDAKKFRAKYYKDKELINSLESKQYIRRDNDKYSVSLIALHEISTFNNDAKNILFLCELVFKVLQNFYRDHAGENINLNDLSELADLPRSDVNKCIPYWKESLLHDGYTTNLVDEDAATITPGEKILGFESFSEAIEDFKEMRESSPEWSNIPGETPISDEYFLRGRDYIHQERLLRLQTLTPDKFDFSRLIKICNEINSCAMHQNYLALIAMIRTLLDHVPPVFGMRSFKEVAANYKAEKSLKKTFEHLENSSRNIADGNIHRMIRRKDSLPTFNQVNFSQDIDRLLEEIIRVIEDDNE